MKDQASTDGAPSAPNILSQAIVSNGFVFVSGQIHNLPDGSMVEGSVEEKLDQIMKNIGAALESAGATLNDVTKVIIYVTEMAQMADLNAAYPKYFSDPLPAREAVGVNELPLGATIEISVVAALQN